MPTYTTTEFVTPLANHLMFNASGTKLYTSNSDGTLSAYNVADGSLASTWSIGSNLGAMALSDDGLWLYVIENYRTAGFSEVYRVNTITGAKTKFSEPGTGAYSDVMVDGNGTVLLSGGDTTQTARGAISRLDPATGSFSVVTGGVYSKNVSQIAEDGRYALFAESISNKSPLFLYDQTTQRFVASTDADQTGVYSGDNRYTAISAETGFITKISDFSTLYVYDLNFAPIRTITLLDSVDGTPLGMTFSPDGKTFYIIAMDKVVSPAPVLITFDTTKGWIETGRTALAPGEWNMDYNTAANLTITPDGKTLYFRPVGGENIMQVNISTADDDIINGTTGADTMAGGVGDDTYLVNHVGDVVIENVDEGYDRINTTINFTLSNSQYIEVLASAPGALGLSLTGNDYANYIIGDAGNNVLVGGYGDDVIEGLDGDDSLNAGPGNDQLFGGNGNDTLTSFDDSWTSSSGTGLSTDILNGGLGNDRYVFDTDGVTIQDDGGIDTVEIHGIMIGSYELPTFIENLRLNEGSLANYL